MDKKTAISKIRKCMALAQSSEPHEAAAAMRQAQKMMERFGIEHPELLAAGVAEEWARSSAKKTPPRYEATLANIVAKAFSCKVLFSSRLNDTITAMVGGYSFIGVTPSSDVAAYTFGVLIRQVKKARVEYIKTALKRHRKNKTAAADLFCIGWAHAVHSLIAAVAPTSDQTKAIDAYIGINHAELKTLAVRDRELSHAGGRLDHLHCGHAAGKLAVLNRGIGAGDVVAIERLEQA
jgi:hypothetical protein